MSTKAAVGMLVGVAALAFLVGLYYGKSFLKGLKTPLTGTGQVFGVISIDQNQSCTQDADFKTSPPLPCLRVPTSLACTGTSILWLGRNASGNRTSLEIDFNSSGLGVGTPFTYPGTATPKTHFVDNEDTGKPYQNYGKDFPFDEVKVGGVPCLKFNGGGVHVDR